MNPNPSPRLRLTPVQWLICIIASIGFAFDIYELLVLPLIVGPALQELTGAARGSPEFAAWVGRLFYIPAFAGGIFGLLGGYLTDRFGRRRILTFSILLYAFSAFFAGFSTSVEMLLFLRCTTFIGVCVEFVAAVAWLAELFTDPKQRERVLGYTQAFSSIGGLLVAVAFGWCVAHAGDLPPIHLPEALNFFGGTIQDPHAPWRYTLMSGVIPAIPLIIIRPFLPESPIWQRKRTEGTLKRPSIAELFTPQLRHVTIITAVMFALSYGAAFGAIQHLPRMMGAVPQIQVQTEGKSPVESRRIESASAADYTKVQEVGGLVGRFLLALLVVRIVSRRALLRVFQVPGLLILPLVYGVMTIHNQTLFRIGETEVTLLHIGVFLAGLLTVAQFSFWGNYLPRVYPLHLRGTGESFAANIGGRMIGTSFAWVTSTLAVQPFIPGDSPPAKLAYAAAFVGLFVYAANFVCSFFLPEPKHEELPE